MCVTGLVSFGYCVVDEFFLVASELSLCLFVSVSPCVPEFSCVYNVSCSAIELFHVCIDEVFLNATVLVFMSCLFELIELFEGLFPPRNASFVARCPCCMPLTLL